jgi:hypothetical protein
MPSISGGIQTVYEVFLKQGADLQSFSLNN